MVYDNKTNQGLLDAEWARLILDARRMGLSIDDIRYILADIKEASNLVRSLEEKSMLCSIITRG